MIFNHHVCNFSVFLLITTFFSSSTATFCSNLTTTDDKNTPCFLASSTLNPARLRTSSSSLILPCHVARHKRSTVEWWYQDFQKTIKIKIYPVYPMVRPTALRFITSNSPALMQTNETDVMDASVLLRHVNVDDSGIYQCVVRPWSESATTNVDNEFSEEDRNLLTLTYHVELSSPRVCQTAFDLMPCFQDTRTGSPTILHAYQTAFLPCIVQNKNLSVFWVVGNATGNNVLLIDHLTSNQHNGDRLRRVFPHSLYDYSIELTINRDTYERTYSCVIDVSGDLEATLLTYTVRSINLEDTSNKIVRVHKNETTTTTTTITTAIIKESETEKPSKQLEKILSHDSLTSKQIDELRQKNSHQQNKLTKEKLKENDDDEEFLEFYTREKTSTKEDK